MMNAEESLLLLNMKAFPYAFVPEEACLGRRVLSAQVQNTYQLVLPWTLAYQKPK